MLYISAYRNSPGMAALMKWLQVLLIVVPTGILLFVLLIEKGSAEHAKLIKVAPWILLLGLFIAWIARYNYHRMLALEVEIDEYGIRHLAPGKPNTLLWQDLLQAKIVPINKYEQAMRVKTKDARYILEPTLVPDTPGAPSLRWGFPRSYWLYPDGRREFADPLHSFGYKIVAQYRPDLLTGRLAPK